MKRRLFKLVVFLLLGAIISVAVAVGCFLFIDGSTSYGQPLHQESWILDHGGSIPSSTVAWGPLSEEVEPAFGVDRRYFKDNSSAFAFYVQAGWPARCLDGGWCTDTEENVIYIDAYLYQLGSDVAIVRRGLWPQGRKANSGSLALEFYLNDQLLKRYSTLDIAVVPDNVSASVSHHRVFGLIHGFRVRYPLPQELRAPDDADETKEPRVRRTPREVFFEVQTIDGRLLIFDLWEGEQVTEQQAGALTEPIVRASRLPTRQD